MANSNVSPKGSSPQAEWMWNASADPFSDKVPSQWRAYSRTDSAIIEQAFAAGKKSTILEDYHIDLEKSLQTSKYDLNKQRPIKRISLEKHQESGKEDRFSMDIISPPSTAYNGQYGWVPIFIKAAAKDLKLTRQQLPSKDKMSIPKIVERAALGIIEESKMLDQGAMKDGQDFAQKLREKKNESMQEVWKCCASLYALESFLYRLLNETMRRIGRPGEEHLWQSKVRTLGPYSLLLWDNPSSTEPSKVKQQLYRGMRMTEEQFKSFQANSFKHPKHPKPEYSFQAFTSSSRNRRVPDTFGNALLIMTVGIVFTVDLGPTSELDEDEELIMPGVCFTIERAERNPNDGKYHIELTLNQRHRREEPIYISFLSTLDFRFRKRHAWCQEKCLIKSHERRQFTSFTYIIETTTNVDRWWRLAYTTLDANELVLSCSQKPSCQKTMKRSSWIVSQREDHIWSPPCWIVFSYKAVFGERFLSMYFERQDRNNGTDSF